MAASLLAMLDRREPGEEPTAEGGIELERAAVPARSCPLDLPPQSPTAALAKAKKGHVAYNIRHDDYP